MKFLKCCQTSILWIKAYNITGQCLGFLNECTCEQEEAMDASGGIRSISRAFVVVLKVDKWPGHPGQIIDLFPSTASMCYLVDKPKTGSFQGLRSLGPKVNTV